MKLNLLNTLRGSLIESFYPKGWDLRRIDRCCAMGLKKVTARSRHWNKEFKPVPVATVAEMDRRMGDAIADEIEQTRKAGRKLAIILPVGPMGMYKTVVERLKSSRTKTDHVHTFNMDEWSDAKGNTMPGDQPGGFEQAMGEALFGPLGRLSVPVAQRNFATKRNLPTYGEKIAKLRRDGARLVTVYGIGRTCHIAFWEPQLAAEYSPAQWRRQTHRLGIALHPLTIEQNALHSFNSRFTLIPCFANSIGPGLFLSSDFCIGGADGAYPDRGAMWQGMSLCVTLKYGPNEWVPSSSMPTLPGKLFFLRGLAGPLGPEAALRSENESENGFSHRPLQERGGCGFTMGSGDSRGSAPAAASLSRRIFHGNDSLGGFGRDGGFVGRLRGYEKALPRTTSSRRRCREPAFPSMMPAPNLKPPIPFHRLAW